MITTLDRKCSMNLDLCSESKPVVAAFDFDGTITTKDTFVPFLQLAFGKLPVLLAFTGLAFEGMKVLTGISSRDRFKEKIVARLFSGEPVQRLKQVGVMHAKAVEAWFRPAALERIRWHKQQGHRLVMVSASLDIYLEDVAQRLGFDDLLCTKPSATQSAFDGGLVGANCRCAEKVRLLETLIGPLSEVVLYAYGDSDGDTEMLGVANYPHFKPFRT